MNAYPADTIIAWVVGSAVVLFLLIWAVNVALDIAAQRQYEREQAAAYQRRVDYARALAATIGANDAAWGRWAR